MSETSSALDGSKPPISAPSQDGGATTSRRRRTLFAASGSIKPGMLSHWYSIPAVIVGLLFTLGPICVIVAFSFMSQPDVGGGVVYKFSTNAYKKLLFTTDFLGRTSFDPRYLKVFGTSLWQALITTFICVVLSFFIALWMSLRKPSTQRLLVLLINIPFWTNLIVRTYAWMLILNENGPINGFLKFIGVGSKQLLYTSGASLIGLIFTFLPFAIMPMYSALSGFDFRLVEAAYDLGARKLTVMRRIILRAAKPGVTSAIALCFIPAFGSYVQPVLLGGGRVLMVGNLIASQFSEARNWPFGAALSTVILLITLLCGVAASIGGGKAARDAGMAV